eukprot:SAG11_NODE_10180_length_849_cov_1.137333_1_plen_102_part_10
MRDALSEQMAEKQQANLLGRRYDMIQEQRRMQEDSRRYQEEIIADMVWSTTPLLFARRTRVRAMPNPEPCRSSRSQERRRSAWKQLSRVWDRQRSLNSLTQH